MNSSISFLVLDGIGDFRDLFDNMRTYAIEPRLLWIVSYLRQNQIDVEYHDVRRVNTADSKVASVMRQTQKSHIVVVVSEDTIDYAVNYVNRQNIASPISFLSIDCPSILMQQICGETKVRLVWEADVSTPSEWVRKLIAKIVLGETISFAQEWDGFCRASGFDLDPEKIYAIETSIGSNGSCESCSSAQSTVFHRNVTAVVHEMLAIKLMGRTCVHLRSLSLLDDSDYCRRFIDELGRYDAHSLPTWSCSGTTRQIEKNKDTIAEFVRRGLVKIELGFGSEIVEILGGEPGNAFEQELKSLLDYLSKSQVHFVTLHFTVGFPSDTKDSIIQFGKILERIIRSSKSLVDFRLHWFYPREGSLSERAFDRKSLSRMLALRKTIVRKGEPICGWPDEEKIETSVYNEHVIKKAHAAMMSRIRDGSCRERLLLLRLDTLGMKSAFATLFEKKGSSYMLFDHKRANPLLRSSWEITGDERFWVPSMTMISYSSSLKNVSAITVDRLLSPTESPGLVKLSHLESCLVSNIDGERNIQEIREELDKVLPDLKLKESKLQDRDILWDVFRRLEEFDLIVFSPRSMLDILQSKYPQPNMDVHI